jgi:hypothetical protein
MGGILESIVIFLDLKTPSQLRMLCKAVLGIIIFNDRMEIYESELKGDLSLHKLYR